MLIYLYGPDSYRRKNKIKELADDYGKKRSNFSAERFDISGNASEKELARLDDFIKSGSLFNDLKFAAVNYEKTDEEIDKELKPLLKRAIKNDGLVLIFSAQKALSKGWEFLLKKPVISQKFETLGDAQFQKFIQDEAQKRGIKLAAESQNLLIQLFKGNSWGLVTELDKLALLDKKTITGDTLENHIKAFLPMDIFASLKRMENSSEMRDKLSILEELFARGVDRGMLFNYLAVIKKNKAVMADYDVEVKRGKLEYEEILTEIALS